MKLLCLTGICILYEQNDFVVFATVGLILVYLPQFQQLTKIIIRIM